MTRRGLVAGMLFTLLASTGPAAALAQVAPEKEAAIRRLMTSTGSHQLTNQVMASLFAQMRPAFPTVPEELWRELETSMKSEEVSELVIPIYDKHFSLEELNGLATFYATPLGKKVIAAMPAVMQESMAVGGEWGRRKAQEMVQRLAEKGFQPTRL